MAIELWGCGARAMGLLGCRAIGLWGAGYGAIGLWAILLWRYSAIGQSGCRAIDRAVGLCGYGDIGL
eukprot:1782422-Pyramimonas_sp.AAC.1